MAWLLECTATMGELRRMTQFKEKSEGKESVRVGLFTYPVLQAADIVLYDAERVPVGDDQRQHLELARDVAIRFNHRFGDTLVVPEAAIPTAGARVMDLQHPERKMSKSVNSPLGTVLVLDDPAEITRKVKKAVTDTDGEVRYDPATEAGGLQPARAAGRRPPGAKPDEVAEGYERYGDLKADTAEALIELLRPAPGPPGRAGRRPGGGARAAGPGRGQGHRGGRGHLRPGGGGGRAARPGMSTRGHRGGRPPRRAGRTTSLIRRPARPTP